MLTVSLVFVPCDNIRRRQTCSQLQKDVGQHECDRARRWAILQIVLRQKIRTQRLWLRRRRGWSAKHGWRNRIHCTNIYITSFFPFKNSLPFFLENFFLNIFLWWIIHSKKYDESLMNIFVCVFQNGPPTSNIPQLAQAHVAPLLANGGTSVRQTNGNGYSKFGSKIDCRRCGKKKILRWDELVWKGYNRDLLSSFRL